jgi:mRNA interferase YafQ
MKALRFAGAFRKDLKRISRRGYHLGALEAVIDRLRAGEPLPVSNRAHPLQGDWKGYWDCHIGSDWVLIYKVTKEEVLLARTGTHADLFAN